MAAHSISYAAVTQSRLTEASQESVRTMQEEKVIWAQPGPGDKKLGRRENCIKTFYSAADNTLIYVKYVYRLYSTYICMPILEHRRDACNILQALETRLNLLIGTVLMHAAAVVF